MSPVQKAGLLYLTLVEAYERCGMMQKEHAPDLLLAHDGKAYEVRYHFLLWRYGETHRHYRRYFSPRVSMQSRAKSVHPSSKLRPPPCTSQRSRPIWSQMRVHATMSRPPRYLWARLWLQWRPSHRRNVQLPHCLGPILWEARYEHTRAQWQGCYRVKGAADLQGVESYPSPPRSLRLRELTTTFLTLRLLDE
jgi:hypothetical protein